MKIWENNKIHYDIDLVEISWLERNACILKYICIFLLVITLLTKII
jgi:hypothetical protein